MVTKSIRVKAFVSLPSNDETNLHNVPLTKAPRQVKSRGRLVQFPDTVEGKNIEIALMTKDEGLRF